MNEVKIIPVNKSQQDTLAGMLQGYQQELQPFTGKSGADIKTYQYLPDYFKDKSRHAFFIVFNDEIAGFALINKHAIVTSDANAIAEFYIKKAFRKQHIGTRAAITLFTMFAGNWEVAQMQENTVAIEFWRSVINEFTGGKYQEIAMANEDWHGVVQTFNTAEKSQ